MSSSALSHDAPAAAEALSSQPLFAGVSLQALHTLLKRCQSRQLTAGEILLAPGQPNQDLFVLIDGLLKAHIDHVGSKDGFLLSPGECAGEISIIDGRPASAFVVAEKNSTVLVIPEQALWEHFLAVPRINRNFMRLFADRFRMRNEVMRKSLDDQLRYEHLQRELDLARTIQSGLLPRCIELEPEFEAAAEMVPAQQIGGDFYDAFPISRDEYCLAVGDVAGKGVPAALFMVRTITLLRTEVLKDQRLEHALAELNRALCAENPTYLFTTLVVGILNRRTRQLRYVTAGHPAPVFGERGARYRPAAVTGGLPLGIEEDATFEADSITLTNGDVVLFYTDGITEAMNGAHQQFGEGRLLECLNGQLPVSAAELASRIRIAVNRYANGTSQSDDLTTLVLRCRES